MKKSLILLLALVAFLPGMLAGQTAKKPVPTAKAPGVVLAFADDPTTIKIIGADKQIRIGMEEGDALKDGDTIVTEKGNSAELKIEPNGSIIKISGGTTFKITELAKAGDPKTKNDFEIASGKIRAVAAKMAGANNTPGYTVKTPTANCGVRGTDFAILVDEATGKEWLCVQEGLVDFTQDGSGKTLNVLAGMFADAKAEVFEVAVLDQARLDELFSDVGFLKLDPQVVKNLVAQVIADAVADAPVVVAEKPVEEPVAEKAPEPAKPDSALVAWIKKVLGMEVGSVTIDGQVWSKAIISPTIKLDGFKMGLYLPIVYKTELFNPDDWYHPSGNDEWSFGTDQTGWWPITQDAVADLALKIRFLEMGRQGFDPFYLKVGNLNTMTIGHGSIMSNFANDQEFPSVRKIGLNFGITSKYADFEAVTDDVAAMQIVGGRLSLKLLGDWLPLGFSTIADLSLVNPDELANNPAFTGKTAAEVGDPILFVAGVDTQLPKLDIGILRALVFADANVVTAWYRDQFTANGTTVKSMISSTLLGDNAFQSYGVEAGILGKVLIVDYRLAFQLEKGLYTNGIFRSNYYRTRTERLTTLNKYLTDAAFATETNAQSTVGVFGSAGFDLFGIVQFEGAYRWPMVLKEDGTIDTSDQDSLKLRLDLPKGKLPAFIPLSGSIGYERTNVYQTLFDAATKASGVTMFDANTTLKGEAIYGVTTGVDLVIGFTTIVAKDANGQIVYEANGTQKVIPSINLETRIGF